MATPPGDNTCCMVGTGLLLPCCDTVHVRPAFLCGNALPVTYEVVVTVSVAVMVLLKV
jgi:hypothetical protein